MDSPADRGSSEELEKVLEEARERIAARQERLARTERRDTPPGDGDSFRERYGGLLEDLRSFVEEIPQVEHEAHGPSGLRIRFAPTDREVRVTALEDQGLVHFVFGHTTLGTLHRAEHHAARPFGERPPDIPRLLRQILSFLIEGVEPRWLTHRPPPGPEDRDGEPPRTESLELPLE